MRPLSSPSVYTCARSHQIDYNNPPVMTKRAALVPLQERQALAQLHSDFTNLDMLVDAMREVLRVGRSDPTVWSSEHTLRMLSWCRLAGSCGGALGDELVVSGIPDILTRYSTEVSKLLCEGAEELDEVLVVCTAALSNACGGSVRTLGDVVLQVVRSEEPPSGSCDDALTFGDDDDVEVVIGFADYTSSETGGRLWAGAVALTLWFHEQHILRSWLATRGAESTEAPFRVCELGCGPALVSAALCAQWNRNSRAQCTSGGAKSLVEVVVTDVSPHVVAEAVKTIRDRNRCPSPIIPDVTTLGADQRLTWSCSVLDFSDIPLEAVGSFDVVYGSDIVYDFAIAAHVPMAIAKLLRPGTGVAYICCESHRDAMKDFVPTIEREYSAYLEVVSYDPHMRLTEHTMPVGVNPLCSLMIFRRTDERLPEDGA